MKDASMLPMHSLPCRRFVTVAVSGILLFSATAFAQEQSSPPSSKGDRSVSGAEVQESGKSTVTLPNGASALNETYGDWTVSCSIGDNQKRCAFSQEQGNAQTGQRIFAVELQPAAGDGQTKGVILLPFGLHLDDGVKLKLDDQDLGKGARFSTCTPGGCLVPVSFPKIATDAMKKAQKLIVTATREGGGEAPTFSVSLNGFTTAMTRVAELAK